MKQKIMNMLVVLVVLATMLSVRPAYAQDEPTIDLALDRNGNQISDAVEAEVAALQALPQDQQAAEIERFVSKLPISADTRALQEYGLKLSESLATATPEEAQEVTKELASLSEKLKDDPAIGKVISDLQTLTGVGRDNSTPSKFVAFSSLKKGDILARRSGWFVLWPWAMWYEHTGNYNGGSQVYESNLDGVRLKPLSNWKVRGHYVGLARNRFANTNVIEQAVEWAKAKYGTDGRTPYNWQNFADKWTDQRLYCSQLTWKIHKNTGHDLDSNAWQYQLYMSAIWGWHIMTQTIPAVAPDEVMLSERINIYSQGWY